MTKYEELELKELKENLDLRLGQFREAEKLLLVTMKGMAVVLGRIRRGKKISLMKMARKMKMSHQTISNMEKGHFVSIKNIKIYLTCISKT